MDKKLGARKEQNSGERSTLCCHWCGVYLGTAAVVTYLNGNLPICDLCLMKVKPEAINGRNKV